MFPPSGDNRIVLVLTGVLERRLSGLLFRTIKLVAEAW